MLRSIKKSDLNGIWLNFNHVVEEGVYLPVYTPVVSDWEKNTWYQELNQARNLCLVAEDPIVGSNNPIAGQITIENVPWEAADHVAILGIIIRKEYRNIGLGYALIEYAKKVALAQGKMKLILSTFTSNQQGISLYKKCGFNSVGVYKNQYLIQEKFIDELLMECFLYNLQ